MKLVGRVSNVDPRDPMACIVEELYFNDWAWHVTSRSALGVKTTEVSVGYSIEFAKNHIEREAWVPELLFIEDFPSDFLMRVGGSQVRFSPRGWKLLGFGTREWDWDWDGYFRWHSEEYLFEGNGTFLLIELSRHVEANHLSNDPGGSFLIAEDAAKWCERNLIDLIPSLASFATVKLLSPDNAKAIQERTQQLDRKETSGDPWLDQSPEGLSPTDTHVPPIPDPKDSRTDKQKRNDWLLNMRGLENDPALTLPELADLLTKKSLATEWVTLEANAISDALRESYSRQFGKTWPFDGRGKKGNKDRKTETRNK